MSITVNVVVKSTQLAKHTMEVISVQETHGRHTHFQHKDATILGAVDDDDDDGGDNGDDDDISDE